MPGGVQENSLAWEPEEDDIILRMHALIGPKWKAISEQMPGRSISSIRNRFQRMEAGRKAIEKGGEIKNRCHSCGKFKRGHICHAKSKLGLLASMVEGKNADQTNAMLRNIQSAALSSVAPVPPPPKLSPLLSRGTSVDGHTIDQNGRTNTELLHDDLFQGQENEHEARQLFFQSGPPTYLRPLSVYFAELEEENKEEEKDEDDEEKDWFGDDLPPILVSAVSPNSPVVS